MRSPRGPGADPVAPTHSWWFEQAAATDAAAVCPPLVGTVEADVAIVGGGYTGLWTAARLRQIAPDLTVILLEAQVCGAGASGRNGGFMNGYWSALPTLINSYGEAAARQVANAGQTAQNEIIRFCRQSAVDTQLTGGGLTVAATSTAQLPEVERILAAASVLPPDRRPQPLSRRELESRYATAALLTGAWFPSSVTLHPARLVGALKAHVLGAGVGIHEASPVIEVTGQTRLTVRTTLGRVRCHHLVMAANAWMSNLPPHRAHVTNLGSYVAVTKPLPDLLDRMDQHGAGMAVRDARMFLNWIRTTGDKRLIIGHGAGPMSLHGRVDQHHTSSTAAGNRTGTTLRRWYPQIDPGSIEQVWGGPIDMSSDRLPYFGTLPGTNVHYGIGYSGHGINACWIGGSILAALAAGDDTELTRSVLCTRHVPRLPPEPIRFIGGRLIHTNTLALEDRLDDGRAPTLRQKTFAGIPRALHMRIGRR